MFDDTGGRFHRPREDWNGGNRQETIGLRKVSWWKAGNPGWKSMVSCRCSFQPIQPAHSIVESWFFTCNYGHVYTHTQSLCKKTTRYHLAPLTVLKRGWCCSDIGDYGFILGTPCLHKKHEKWATDDQDTFKLYIVYCVNEFPWSMICLEVSSVIVYPCIYMHMPFISSQTSTDDWHDGWFIPPNLTRKNPILCTLFQTELIPALLPCSTG